MRSETDGSHLTDEGAHLGDVCFDRLSLGSRLLLLFACAYLGACVGTGSRHRTIASLNFETQALDLGTGHAQVVSLISGAGQDPPVIPVPVAIVLRLSSGGFPARLELSEPQASDHARASIGWVRVAGRVLSGDIGPLDLVIAIDDSSSAFLPSGTDLDGDGVVGAVPERGIRRSDGSLRDVRKWTTDPQDSVFEVSRALARRIMDTLAQQDVRVGILTFSERIRVWARPGPVERARRAVDSLRVPLTRGGTNLRDAIRIGGSMLAPWPDDGRQKILMVISDGFATRPGNLLLRAHRATQSAVQEVERRGVSIYWVKVGADLARDPEI